MPHKHLFLLCLIGFLGAVLLENVTVADQAVQAFFYDHGQWLISKADHARLKDFWYTGPKVLLGLLAGLSLTVALLSLRLPGLRRRLGAWVPFLFLLGLSIACVPLAAAGLKAVTGVRGPVDLIPYGGAYRHIGFLSHLLQAGTVDNGWNFPAGHAAGGFALMALGAAPARRSLRTLGLAAGLSAGWAMGLYQMARGEHFFSHTLATMFLAGCIITLLLAGCEVVTKRIGSSA